MLIEKALANVALGAFRRAAEALADGRVDLQGALSHAVVNEAMADAPAPARR